MYYPSSVPEKFHDSSDICPMGFVYSIQVCEISHPTFGPSEMSDVSDDFHEHCPRFIQKNTFTVKNMRNQIYILKKIPSRLTHCGLVMSYANKDLGQHWLR